VVADVTKFLSGLADALTKPFQDAAKTISGAWQGVLNTVNSVIDALKTALGLQAQKPGGSDAQNADPYWQNSGGGAAGHAMGGPVSGGVPILIGENGPELFLPSGAGNIIPNNALKSSGGRGGGGGAVLNITNPVFNGVQDVSAFFDQLQSEAARRNIQLGSRVGG
jgi:hypothetical protein